MFIKVKEVQEIVRGIPPERAEEAKRFGPIDAIVNPKYIATARQEAWMGGLLPVVVVVFHDGAVRYFVGMLSQFTPVRD